MQNDRLLTATASVVFAILVPLIVLPSPAQDMQADLLATGRLPTETPAGADYAGSEECLRCHARQAGWRNTAMSRALERPHESAVLQANPTLTLEQAPYRYQIARRDGRWLYTVTDGESTISLPIQWSMGRGKAGQTYIVEYQGAFYESRVSYYLRLERLDLTLGAQPGTPASLVEAMGRKMNDESVGRCFGCHSTGAVRASELTLDRLIPGITCEGCHGPGRAHIAAIAGGQLDDIRMDRFTRFTAEQEADFCGSCHRTWAQVILMNVQGPASVRFHAYRLVNSACYDTEDARIRCTACHDPHDNPRQDAAFYDAKCLACHRSGAAGSAQQGRHAKACPTATEKCSSCHMPKVELPGGNSAFSDHHIRIARPGDPFPN